MKTNKQEEPPFIRVFILAGGKSSRMGKPKAKLKLGKKTFLELISATARKLSLPVTVIDRDVGSSCGPVGGILSAFNQHPCDAGLFLSCDMPLLVHEFLRHLLGEYERTGRAIFTQEAAGPGFPFILPGSALRQVETSIAQKDYSLQTLARLLGALRIEIAPENEKEFLNVNTPADFHKAERLWAAREKDRRDIVLEVKGINVRRGNHNLVADFNWSIRRGEHWVILGANGSGKTTLLSALLGYITPTGGEIAILGEEYGEADWPELRKKIGLVSSSVRQMMAESEPAWITVASGKYAVIDFWGKPTGQDRKKALELLKSIECEYLAERPWSFLSQGERQRVLIGRALMSDPSLLILDEPCAGLDPVARENFLQFLDRLGQGANAPALVLVTHHVEEIMPVFTHALLLKNGRNLREGRVKEMLSNEALSAAFSAPMKVEKAGSRYYLNVEKRREGSL